MRTSIVISAHNKAQYFESFLRTVRRQCPDAQLVLVDDGSTDATGDIMARYGDVVLRTENVWETKANNAGLAAATGEVVAILQDDDLPVAMDWVNVCGRFMRTAGIDILGGRGTGQWFYRGDTPLEDRMMTLPRQTHTGVIKLRRWTDDDLVYTLSYYHRGMQGEGLMDVEAVECQTTIRSPFIITRKVLDTVGLFDEVYAPLTRDTHDLCLRAQRHGLRTASVLIPQLTRYGGGSADLYQGWKADFFQEASDRNQKTLLTRFRDEFPVLGDGLRFDLKSLGTLSFILDVTAQPGPYAFG